MFCDGGCSTFCADISSCLGEEESSASEGQNRTRRTIVCTLYSYEMNWILLAMTSMPPASSWSAVVGLPPLGACAAREAIARAERAEPRHVEAHVELGRKSTFRLF